MTRPSANDERLRRFLQFTGGDRLTLPFAAIEGVLQRPLPPAASTDRWWSNARGARHSQAWLAAGWRVEPVPLGDQTVTFTRQPAHDESAPTAAGSGPWDARAVGRSDRPPVQGDARQW